MLLASLSAVMILVNGSRAIEGILGGQKPSRTEETPLQTESKTDQSLSQLDFGAYDPQGTLNASKLLKYEMLYISWLDVDPASFAEKLDQVRHRGRVPVITVEAWARNEETLLREIVAGGYDAEIKQLTDLIAGFGDTVWVSWGHEMDQDLIKRYPWSGKPPAEFLDAYTYVHKRCMDACARKIRWIWAPVAKTGSMNYYPGDDYVDAVGLPVYAFPEWENSYFGYIKSFEETFAGKISHLKTPGKPVFITEFGLSGSEDFKAFWLRNAFLSFGKFESLKAVFFFQATETPGVWGENISAPDWKLPATTIEAMVQWAKKN